MTLTNAEKTRLGVFVLSGMGLVVLSIIALTGTRLFSTPVTFVARFYESISGLEENAPVRYQGLRVGRVESMRIAEDDPKAIDVIISVERGTVLYEGTEAILDMSGITGLRNINLTPGDPRKPPLAPGSRLHTGPSLIDAITGQAATIMSDVKTVSQQLTRWTRDDNRERLESLLRGLDSFIGHLDVIMSDSRVPFAEALKHFNHTAEAITHLANESASTMHVVRDTLTHTESAVVETLEAFRRPIKEVDPRAVSKAVTTFGQAAESLHTRLASESTGRAIKNFGDTMDTMSHLIQDVDLAVRTGRQDFTLTLSYLRQAAEDLREFSRTLAQNPSVLVRGRGEAAE